MNSKIQKIIGSGIILGLCVLGFLGFSVANSNKGLGSVDSGASTNNPLDNTLPVANNNLVVNTPVAGVTNANKYKDGTYVAVGSYQSPAGPEQVSISLSIKDDVIVDTSATNIAQNKTSIRYENKFISGYKALVIGKSLDTVRLDRVSGSSLTPNGFNDAVAKIKAQALS